MCAIELIGVELLQRDTEITALRQVREELLATTDAGRRWVALFERVQAPLIGTVLADAHLSQEAAALLEAVGRSTGDDNAPCPATTSNGRRPFSPQLTEQADLETVRSDIEAVRVALAQMAGLPLTDAVQVLMRTAPSGPRSRCTQPASSPVVSSARSTPPVTR